MDSSCDSTSTAGVLIGDAIERVTSPCSPGAGLPLTLLHLAKAPLPFTKLDPKVVSNDSKTLPVPYAESNMEVILGDLKDPPNASSSLLLHSLNRNGYDRGSALCINTTEEPSPSHLCDQYGQLEDVTASLNTISLDKKPTPFRCTTICTPASKGLNYHVNSDNYVYRWRTSGRPIPIGINFSSFESRKQWSLVKRCLIQVLDSLNAHNVGPQFQYIDDPSDSAFFISFGGDDPQCYATSFFPGSLPKDWYIYVFRLSLKLSKDQQRFLKDYRSRDIKAARTEALEQNLIRILAHEMLHIMGVRHCDIDPNAEREAYVRFPPGLSDNDNRDPMMQPRADWMNLSQLDWKLQTLEEIRQIYAMKEGSKIGGHRIRDVSWRDGAKIRERIARINARCSIPRPRNNK